MSVERIHHSHQEEKEKPNYLKIVRRMGAALAAVLVIGGIVHDSKTDVVPLSDKQEQESERAKNIELKNIKVGEYVEYQEGIYEIDSTKLNIRSGPFVDHDTDNRVRLNEGSDHFYVSNPVYIQSDGNGDWFEAVDANGKEVYMVGDKGGISNVSTGEESTLSKYGLESAEVIATTTKGNAAKTEDGENVLIATIENAN